MAAAQEDDRGRLVQLLEEALSDQAARQVRIDGFRGALSAQASLDRLTIADEEGVWLTLEDVTLDWNRRALFSRALEVTALTARRLELARLPQTENGLPAAEAQPFSLPELPLSIRIDQTAIDRVEIGEPVFGQALTFSIIGAAELAGGEGNAELQLDRIDGPQGQFRLIGSFENQSRVAAIDLLFEEEAGGLAATLLGIPGEPSVRLTVDGQGPLTAFAADFALETDATPRLTGGLQISQSEEGDQTVALDMSGDVTAIVLPEYREFFGPDISLVANVTQDASGILTADPMRLTAAAMNLEGRLVLNAERQPESFALTGAIDPAGQEEDRVVLPISGGDLSVATAALDIGYDRTAGNTWRGEFELRDLISGDFSASDTVLNLTGEITEAVQGLAAITAEVAATTTGLSHTDPDLATALGDSVALDTLIRWEDTRGLTLSDLRLTAGNVALEGEMTADLADAQLGLDYALQAEIGDLTRFAPLAGEGLAGAASLSVDGTAEALSGSFDTSLAGQTRDLRLTPDLPPQLFAGATDLTARLRRDETGVTLEDVSLTGQEVTLEGSGRLSSTESELLYRARLRNISLFTSALSGQVDLRGGLIRTGDGPWTTQTRLDGPGGTTLVLLGEVGLPDGAVNLGLTGRAPLPLADRFIAPRTVRGDLAMNLRLSGAPDLRNLSGELTTTGTRVAAPTIGVSLTDVTTNAAISGGSVRLTTTAALSTGGQISANGSVAFTGRTLPAQLDIALDDLRLIDPELFEATVPQARLTYSGNLTGAGRLAGEVLIGETEIRVPESSLGTTEPIPEITHVGESAAQRQTRAFAGLLRDTSGNGNANVALDLTISAPGRIFLRGRGLDAELGGTLRVRGTAANAQPDGQFDLIRGRLGILGQRLDLVEGSATLSGSFDPFIRLVAQSRSGQYLIQIILEGLASAPEVRFTSEPELPEDEVLAQFFFGRSISSLSAVQALQLADAVSGLAGGGTGGGIFASLRENLGLDDLDIQTTEDGNAALRAGRYISDNIYTDVTVGSDDGTTVNLNIDLTPNVTARGSFGADGDSSLGVFFERDY